MTVSDDLYAARLTIDLDTVAANYRLLQGKLDAGGAMAGAAVKGNGYGLGARPVVRALANAGCVDFFVAHPHEGVVVRDELPDVRIHVLNGPLPDAIDDYLHHDLVPVLNSLGDIDLWRNAASERGRALKADVHIDTGMCRLGLDLTETETLLSDAASLLEGIDLGLVMSHLASADVVESDQSARQLPLFKTAFERLGRGAGSLCNSAGIFLGPDYFFSVARPGVALYGGNPTPHLENPMSNPVCLEARVLQVRTVDTPETVGYGATHAVDGKRRVATVPIGYADGFHRLGSSKGFATIDGHEAPIIGRVSMDLITLDVTDVPDHLAQPGAMAEFMGRYRTPDDLARDWQTIPYEVLTGLGQRYARTYKGAGA
ncbi:MAG: alanine racemase [Rhodospirillales bacterium]|nr:alanine racemase [Rhodospirillales bacterium]MBO6786233.1 alanine racemase [Rhodospirillales bacterium]